MLKSIVALLNMTRSRVIKRRVAWLIGKWVREEGPTPNPVLLWEVVLHLLQDRDPVGSDMVVRLTAAEALKDCVNVCARFYFSVIC